MWLLALRVVCGPLNFNDILGTFFLKKNKSSRKDAFPFYFIFLKKSDNILRIVFHYQIRSCLKIKHGSQNSISSGIISIKKINKYDILDPWWKKKLFDEQKIEVKKPIKV